MKYPVLRTRARRRSPSRCRAPHILALATLASTLGVISVVLHWPRGLVSQLAVAPDLSSPPPPSPSLSTSLTPRRPPPHVDTPGAYVLVSFKNGEVLGDGLRLPVEDVGRAAARPVADVEPRRLAGVAERDLAEARLPEISSLLRETTPGWRGRHHSIDIVPRKYFRVLQRRLGRPRGLQTRARARLRARDLGGSVSLGGDARPPPRCGRPGR